MFALLALVVAMLYLTTKCFTLHAFPPPLAVNALLASLGYVATSYMTLAMRPVFIKAKLFGIDLNKPETKRDANGVLIRPLEGPIVPEAMGAIASMVYLVLMFMFIPCPFLYDYAEWGATIGGWGRIGGGGGDAVGAFPHAHLSKFLCALLAICCMCFLGFADNVLDLRWRDRLWLPLAASLPLLIVYAVDGGGTQIIVPKIIEPWFGSVLQLGMFYYVFMACLAIFCTNAINILAGVNGLEAGQAVVIAATILVNNLIQVCRCREGHLHDNNLFSLYLVLPFFGVGAALMRHNWYPSKVFVGDTFCYFAGMTFAVAAILGHNSKTLLLFFVPQVFNFLYSIPQLLRVIPCPRHRMPTFMQSDNKVCNSFAEIDPAKLGTLGRGSLWLCETFKLARVERLPGQTLVRISNLTIINYLLFLTGPVHEQTLCVFLLTLQAVCSALALCVRYQLAGLLYDTVR